MTAVLPPRQSRGDRAPVATEAGGHAGGAAAGAPVIVLTYPNAGTERLWSLLTAHPALACTSATGVLPLCEQAAATWRGVDGRVDTRLCPLAANSTRALTTAVIITMLARHGGRRWCEFATAPPRAAETFLQLYPQARVLCLHRSCTDVIQAALHASPWGLAGPEYAPFTAAYPASTVAALTAYWTAVTAPLVAFEESHPDACRRVRYEDLTEGPYTDDLFAFLGMDAPHPGLSGPASPGAASTSPGPAHRALSHRSGPRAAPCASRSPDQEARLSVPDT